MKYPLAFLSWLVLALPLVGQTAFEEGIEAYGQAQYSSAIASFEQALVESPHPSAALYYNLGNAYYKNNELASAILAYERAYRLDPAARDIRHNLELASSMIEDQISPAPTALLTRKLDDVSRWVGLNTWLALDIVLLLLICALVLLYFYTSKRGLRLMGFYGALIGGALFIFTNTMTFRLNSFIQDTTGAVITAPVVTVKSSPDQSATDIVVLHSGVRVTVQKSVAGFHEIVLEDGVVGWIPQSDLEFIVPR